MLHMQGLVANPAYMRYIFGTTSHLQSWYALCLDAQNHDGTQAPWKRMIL